MLTARVVYEPVPSVVGLSRHRHRRQRLHGGVFTAQRAHRDHGPVDVSGQAAAGEQDVQRVARGHAAVDGRRGFTGHQCRLHHQLQPGLASQRVERGRQCLRIDADVHSGYRCRRCCRLGVNASVGKGEGDG
jgi:hypothetical protein